MRPIQTNPVGLLGSLGLKQMGQNPPDFLDQIRGTVDLWKLYMEASATFLASLDLPLALGDTSLQRDLSITPPQNRAWWVHGVNLRLGIQATGTATLIQARLDRVLVADPSKHECLIGTQTIAPVTVSTVGREWSLSLPHPIILVPGEALSPVYSAQAIAVLGGYISVGVRYTEFPV